MGDVVRQYVPAGSVEEQWDLPGLEKVLAAEWQLDLPVGQWLKDDREPDDEDIVRLRIAAAAAQFYDEKVSAVGAEQLRPFERA